MGAQKIWGPKAGASSRCAEGRPWVGCDHVWRPDKNYIRKHVNAKDGLRPSEFISDSYMCVCMYKLTFMRKNHAIIQLSFSSSVNYFLVTN